MFILLAAVELLGSVSFYSLLTLREHHFIEPCFLCLTLGPCHIPGSHLTVPLRRQSSFLSLFSLCFNLDPLVALISHLQSLSSAVSSLLLAYPVKWSFQTLCF